MTPAPRVLLSGFADEAAIDKTLDQQFSVFAALGLDYFTIRFFNLGEGVKNVMALTDSEIELVKLKMADYGLSVSSIGSPIGKVKLLDFEDGTKTPYRPFENYLRNEVLRVCQIAQQFETRLIRGFSFYPPKGQQDEQYFSEAVDRLGQITDHCQKAGMIFGLEVEANLVGNNGHVLAEIYRQINHPAMVLIFDGANLVMQGYSTAEVFDQYQAMKPGLGWIHIKDCRRIATEESETVGYVDEDKIDSFVPADQGDSGHEAILKDFAAFLPELQQRMESKGVPGVFADLEPHLKGGGQFGGYSGPDGFGIALRSFCSLCDRCGIDYRLRGFQSMNQ
jgi:sugar phosphate isomerase/epimerase